MATTTPLHAAPTYCEVCDVESEPLTLATFHEEVFNPTGIEPDPFQPFAVCAGCVEAHEEMERDDPECPKLYAYNPSGSFGARPRFAA